MNRLVVFGADGFIGKNLVNELAKVESNLIIAFDRFSAYKNGEKHEFDNLSNVTIVPGDFFNRSDVENILNKDDYVFHLVSSTNPAASDADPFIDIDTNIRSSVELFEICVEKNIKKVIYPSSGGTVYGDIESERISETTPTMPRSPYGIAKLTIEGYLRYFNYRHALNYIVYRIANPYGVGQNVYGKQGVIPIFMHQYIKGEPITIYGDGTMIRDYIYITDLVKGIVKTYDKANKYSEYNLGSGKGSSINDLITAIESILGEPLEKQYRNTPATYVSKSVLDNRRFINEFGIEPNVSLQDGIKKTWEYVRSVEK